MKPKNKIHKLYFELLKKHGPAGKYWPQWCNHKKTLRVREAITIGSILTQTTSWHNADLALINLQKAGLLSIKKIAELSDLAALTELVKPAGFWQAKPKRIWNLCWFVKENEGLIGLMEQGTETIRKHLLSLSGVGPETADTILLYGLDKPSFVIDEYTKRLVRKRGLAEDLKYDSLKTLFEKNLPVDTNLYQDFHALIIVEQKACPQSLKR